MEEIILAVVIVSLIGLIIGVGLSFASSVFGVKKDEIEEKVRECLPGANCGACGYSGCDGYAQAISKGETQNISLCTPGGNDVANEIAEITGKKAEEIKPLVAVVACKGNCNVAPQKVEYSGIKSCKAAHLMMGGQKTCVYGCLGYGDCISACDNGAIFICDGIAKIDISKCGACTKCINACPKGLISLIEANKKQAYVMCKNKEKGAAAQKSCKVSCIGCGKCQKECPESAITVENFLATVDPLKCTGCGICKDACPKKCIDLLMLIK
ncbi:MAG: RnfABCDGE type electron transport complex subunit B [Clostridiales bacterium]|nr:RnfABCDGE type electron transport complex subunit B [Clostridiales bacterium]